MSEVVIRAEAETTEVRIVFDMSCRARKSEESLNDCLRVRPTMTPLILDIKIALVGDIEKAFLKTEVIPNDRKCVRFLWFDDTHSQNPKIVVYRST